MFKNLFSNRLFIGALAFFILCVGGSLLYMQHVKEQTARASAETQDRVKQYNERQNEQPTAETVVSDTSQGGHSHADGTKHNGEETTQPAEKKLTHTEIMQLPLEQQKQIFNSFYTQHGLKPPPRGYDYRWKEPGIPLLDENGDPILHKRGEPIVEITMQKAFTPTLEEYKMLEALDIEAGWQKHQGNIAEAEKLRAEHDQLYEKVQRVRPAGGSIYWVAPKSVKERDPQKGRRMLKEKLRAALIEQGYSYLIPILQERGEL
ncbi:MAG: hypothetical protein F4Z15_09985 [Gammaproteobacteria bacterium]|nr:hypothetical protein [Gammaproteobacteria bacterium]